MPRETVLHKWRMAATQVRVSQHACMKICEGPLHISAGLAGEVLMLCYTQGYWVRIPGPAGMLPDHRRRHAAGMASVGDQLGTDEES